MDNGGVLVPLRRRAAPRAPVSVCLIIPPSGFLLDERCFPSLGLLRVAAALEAAGHPVEVLDLSGVQNYEEAVRSHAGRSAAEAFGLTATTPQLPAAKKIIAVLRQASPGRKVILGGPHATLVSAANKKGRARAARALRDLEALADVLVAGDGEDAIFSALALGRGLIDADDPSGPLFQSRAQLEAAPLPARHLLDMDSYRYTVDGVRATSLIAQLGCPFACGFCGGRSSPMLRRVRMRSTGSILSELEHLYLAYGYRGAMFQDDELNVNPRLVELMDGITALGQRLGIEWRFRGFVKAELFTDAQAAAMHRAGFRWLLSGFESGSPRILDNIQKRATVKDNTRAVETAHRHGLKVKALMSIGHPGETEETVQATRDWLLQVQPDDIDVTIITPYPGSPYYDEAQELRPGVFSYTAKGGDRLHALEVDYGEIADYYKGDPDGGYRSYVFTDRLSAEALVALRDETEQAVRGALQIPFYRSAAAIRYEHSMGQSPLPRTILRASEPPPAKESCR